MQRQHLFEFEDAPWLPAAIRDGAIDLLDEWAARLGVHDALAPVLASVLKATGAAHIVDLCSGAGGPVLRMHARLPASLAACTLTLTGARARQAGRESRLAATRACATNRRRSTP